MNASVKFEDNSSDFLRCVDHASKEALKAAAYVYYNAVKSKLKGGYTTGNFVTGLGLNAVTRTEPTPAEAGYEIVVGTNVDYAVYWELGHHNVFTRKYERVEIWLPSYWEYAEKIREEFKAVFIRIFKACKRSSA